MFFNVESAHESLYGKSRWHAQMISSISFRFVGEPALWDARFNLKIIGIHVFPYQLKGGFLDLPFFHHHQAMTRKYSENHLPGVIWVKQCLGAAKSMADAIGLRLSSTGNRIIVISRIERRIFDIIGMVG